MSNGQGLDRELEKELRGLAARNACTERNTARTRRFKLLRDLKAVEKRIGQNLSNAELILMFTSGIDFLSRFSIRQKHGMITWPRFSRSFKRFACQQAKAKHSRKRLSTFRHFRFLHCH